LAIWLHRVPNLHLCTKFHQNRMIFSQDMAILRFAIWRPSAILNFRNIDSMSIMWPLSSIVMLFCLPMRNFNEVGQSGAKLWPKTILRMAAIRHLEYWKMFIFGHLAVVEIQMCICVPNFIKIGWLLPDNSMHKRSLCRHAVFVCLSCSYILSKRINVSSFFSPSSSHSILVFPHQSSWQFSDGNSANGGDECR